MEKKIINEEQFRKLVINEAKKIFSEKEKLAPIVESTNKEKRKIKFNDVENLIKEMETMNKSIVSLSLDLKNESKIIEESKGEETKPNRDLDVNEHNRKKNYKHINENEKDRFNRMLNYNVPKDEDR